MVTIIISSLIFSASTFALGLLIFKKLPELIMVPDSVITRHLEDNSSRVHFLLLRLRAFFWRGGYKIYFLRLAEKFIVRTRVVIMRLDNLTAKLLKIVRMKLGLNNGFTEEKTNVQEKTVSMDFPFPAPSRRRFSAMGQDIISVTSSYPLESNQAGDESKIEKRNT